MRSFAVLVILVATVAMASATISRSALKGGPHVVCGSIPGCEQCAGIQRVGGIKVAPCFWDWESNSCTSMQLGEHCNGNQVNTFSECNSCKNKWQARKAAKAHAAAAAAAAHSTPSAAGNSAHPGSAAAPAKKNVRCAIGPTPGVCVASKSACTGGRPTAAHAACAGAAVCCGLAVKSSKAVSRDACAVHNNKCTDCLRKGKNCVYHKNTSSCVNSHTAFGRAGDAHTVRDDTFCFGVKDARNAQRAKNIQKAIAKKRK